MNESKKLEEKQTVITTGIALSENSPSTLAGGSRGGKNNSFPTVDQLSEECLQQRQYLQEKSQLLFTLKQNYMKKIETFKQIKQQNLRLHQDYYMNATNLALKDAELKYQRQSLLNQELVWNQLFTEQLGTISTTRQQLINTLQQYRQLREQISAFQHIFHLTTEDLRIHTLNSIVFCNYSKSVIENEIRKNYLLNKLFQQKKEMLGAYHWYEAQLKKMKESLKEYQINKINIFRRYERIYVGKSKELLEQQQLLASNSYSYQFSLGMVGGEDSNHTSDNEEQGPAGAIAAHPPSHPVHSRPSKARSGSIRRASRKSIAQHNPAAAIPYVPYGPAAGTPNFPNPFAIDNFGSQINLLPAEEQQKLQAQQQQEQQKDATSSLMYQLMNSLDEDDEDEDNLGYNKDSLEHRIARKIIIMDMPELVAQQKQQQLQQSGKGSSNNPLGNSMSDDDDVGNELHLPSLKNDKSGAKKGSKGRGKGKQQQKNGEQKDDHANANINTNEAHGNDSAGARTRRLSIVQHGDFVQFVDRFNKSRHNKSPGSNAEEGFSPSKKSGKGDIESSGSLVGEKSSVLSFPEYPFASKKKKKRAATGEKSNPVIIYDPQAFAEACSGDYIRPNTILDATKGIGDREGRLTTLVDNCCVAKGKVKQLTSIKEGLNRELMKQACILFSIISDFTRVKGNTNSSLTEQMKLQSIFQHPQLKDLLALFQGSPHHQKLHFERVEKEKSIDLLKEKVTKLLYSTTKDM